MSLFLGKIHYILYNKILWFESIENKITQDINQSNTSIEDLIKHINKHFGEPVGNKPLEEVIDTNNIHGWLQTRIENAEMRHAALITELLTWNPNYKVQLLKIFTNQGEEAAKAFINKLEAEQDEENDINIESAPQIYQALNEFILEGMPCDRVNEIVKNEEDEVIWMTTRCLHEDYWNRVGGDVINFYELREAWISAFVNELNNNYKYEKTTDGLNVIRKKS